MTLSLNVEGILLLGHEEMSAVALKLEAVLQSNFQYPLSYCCKIFKTFGVVIYLSLFCAFTGKFVRMHYSPVCTLPWLEEEHNVSEILVAIFVISDPPVRRTDSLSILTKIV